MAYFENLPFPRGSTFYNGGTIDSNNLQGLNLEGQEYLHEDLDFTNKYNTPRSDRLVRVRVVRNVAAAALLPKRLARMQASGLYYNQRVDGYTTVDNARGYPIDEFLAATGVPVNDLFYVVVGGPATVLTSLSGAGFNGDVAVGSVLVALTAATSGATTAGRAAVQNITASTQTADYSAIINAVQNRIGHALSAKTTGQTNEDLLVDVGKW